MRVRHRVIAVTGAIGGAGASVAAAALALGMRRHGSPVTLVDLDGGAPGIELLLGIEEIGGVRWPDLGDAQGEIDGEGLVDALPHWHGVPVVSVRRRSPLPPDDVVLDVCAALVATGRTAVLDLPRPSAWTGTVRELLRHCETAVLVAPLTFPGAAGAELVRDQFLAAGVRDVRVVVRRPAAGRVNPEALGTALRLPVAGVLERDRALAAAVERGDGPPAGRRHAVGRLADDLGDL